MSCLAHQIVIAAVGALEKYQSHDIGSEYGNETSHCTIQWDVAFMWIQVAIRFRGCSGDHQRAHHVVLLVLKDVAVPDVLSPSDPILAL